MRHFNIYVCSLFTFIFLLISQDVFAVGISTYRIKLDNDKTESEFIVFNKSAINQQCSITLSDISFNEFGERVKTQDPDPLDISAKKLLRYSPKNFQIVGNGSQSIRFQYRRKRTSSPQEYRSYLSLMCDSVLNDALLETQVSITPKLRINVPIIVRTGEIPVEVMFSNTSYNNGKLTVEVTKVGKRSVYGLLEVVNRTTGEVISVQKGFSLHTEVTKNTHEFFIKNLDVSNIDIQFREDTQLSGDLVIKQSL